MTRVPDALRRAAPIILILSALAAHAQDNLPYTTYTSFAQMLQGGGRYPGLIRVSEPGSAGQPAYTGFFFYQCLQFDATGRYLLGLKIYVQNRPVQPADRGDIGVIDLKANHKWTKIGETAAWNWQQGARLQWRPKSNEILWNDRSDDGKSYVCRVYDFRTRKKRTLPRPIYDLSPDGATALTHDFERMEHRGTPYAGIEGKAKDAPDKTGIWRMDLDTGKTGLVVSLEKMAALACPNTQKSLEGFYIFREGWNPSGTRFMAFVKCAENNFFRAYSATPDGRDIRFLYDQASHHSWRDDSHVLDWGNHVPPGGGAPVKGYFLFKDDGTGRAKEMLWACDYNGHDSYVPGPGGDWLLSDTYSIDGFQYLFMYHLPTKLFVPLAKLRSTAGQREYRVDLHPRLSRDGKMVSIDSTYENIGRQMYVMDISHIVGNPPNGPASAQ